MILTIALGIILAVVLLPFVPAILFLAGVVLLGCLAAAAIGVLIYLVCQNPFLVVAVPVMFGVVIGAQTLVDKVMGRKPKDLIEGGD